LSYTKLKKEVGK